MVNRGDHQHHPRPVGHQGAQEEGGGGGTRSPAPCWCGWCTRLALHAVLRVGLPEGGGQVRHRRRGMGSVVVRYRLVITGIRTWQTSSGEDTPGQV